MRWMGMKKEELVMFEVKKMKQTNEEDKKGERKTGGEKENQ